MDQVLQYLEPLLRWFHIVWGIVWIGLLYFFNWVNGPFAATMDGDTKKKVIPELMPRALFWFRMGALFTWIFGFLLVGIIYDYQNMASAADVGGGRHALIYSFLLAPFIYDFLAKSIKDNRVMAAVGFILTGIIIYLLQCCGFTYRGYSIFTGAMFGTIMAYNVWFRIWPNQKKIITGVKTGNPADASIVATAGARSKHNTYMSIPLVWTMINAHTTKFADSWVWLLVAIFVGWMAANGIYKRSAKIKGF